MDLSGKSVAQLEREHQELDERVAELRRRQLAIHAEIVHLESLERKAGDPKLLQRVGQITNEDQARDLAKKDPEQARRIIEAMKAELEGKEE